MNPCSRQQVSSKETLSHHLDLKGDDITFTLFLAKPGNILMQRLVGNDFMMYHVCFSTLPFCVVTNVNKTDTCKLKYP